MTKEACNGLHVFSRTVYRALRFAPSILIYLPSRTRYNLQDTVAAERASTYLTHAVPAVM